MPSFTRILWQVLMRIQDTMQTCQLHVLPKNIFQGRGGNIATDEYEIVADSYETVYIY